MFYRGFTTIICFRGRTRRYIIVGVGRGTIIRNGGTFTHTTLGVGHNITTVVTRNFIFHWFLQVTLRRNFTRQVLVGTFVKYIIFQLGRKYTFQLNFKLHHNFYNNYKHDYILRNGKTLRLHYFLRNYELVRVLYQLYKGVGCGTRNGGQGTCGEGGHFRVFTHLF